MKALFSALLLKNVRGADYSRAASRRVRTYVQAGGNSRVSDTLAQGRKIHQTAACGGNKTMRVITTTVEK